MGVFRPFRTRPLAWLARALVLHGFALGAGAAAAQPDAPVVPATSTLPAVTVNASGSLAELAEAERGQQLDMPFSNGALGARTQRDTPFSTTIVGGENLADRQVVSLGGVFALDAAVTDNSNAYGSWASYLTVRGVQLDRGNAYKIDGMPFMAMGNTLPYEQLAQVELLKGSAAFMYGFGTPGGVVNYVTRKPPGRFLASVEAGYRTAHIWWQHADVGGRAGPDDMLGYRLNLTHEEGKPSNAVGIHRNSVSLALDARLSRDLTWSFDGLYQDRDVWGQTPSFATYRLTGGALPGEVSGRGGVFAGPDQHLYTNLQLYTTGLRYQLNPDWVLSTRYAFSKQARNRNEGIYVLRDRAGNYDDFRYDGPQANRYAYWDAMAQGRFHTGPLAHALVAGISWQHQRNAWSSGTDKYFQLGTGNLFRPNTNVYFSEGGYRLKRVRDVDQKAAFVSDTVQLTERWSILGGLRYTNFEQTRYAATGAIASTYSKRGVLSPTAALMYQPLPGTMLYASYVESLEPGQLVSDRRLANYGQQLDPVRSKQYEVGVKTERDKWTGTAALFRLERSAQYRQGDYMAQDGLEIYQGVEFESFTRFGQWDLTGSAMYLDSRYARGNANQGNRVAGAPNLVLAAGIGYRIPFVPGLRVGVDGKYTSTAKLRPAGDITLGGYAVFNAGASYHTRIGGKEVTLRAALSNLANRRYWGFQYADYIQPADPRAFSLSARIAY
ncbi:MULTISPECIES: TonB-dependent siderophore receptor [unclassified Cupriavidus]|uniref:TonB-dependent siderophore receptor n=1 Tax=Cupriavidus sp. H19C3 TaxID=3241603 RepID=UPI003BF8FEC7